MSVYESADDGSVYEALALEQVKNGRNGLGRTRNQQSATGLWIAENAALALFMLGIVAVIVCVA